VLWRVVSVGSKLLSLYSQMYTCVAILLDLLFTTIYVSCLFLDSVTAILWDLACLVLVVMISGSAGAVFSVLLPRPLFGLDPGPAQ
jgi:hypothetical protein